MYNSEEEEEEEAHWKPKKNQVLLNARARGVTPVFSPKILLTSQAQNTQSRSPIDLIVLLPM